MIMLAAYNERSFWIDDKITFQSLTWKRDEECVIITHDFSKYSKYIQDEKEGSRDSDTSKVISKSWNPNFMPFWNLLPVLYVCCHLTVWWIWSWLILAANISGWSSTKNKYKKYVNNWTTWLKVRPLPGPPYGVPWLMHHEAVQNWDKGQSQIRVRASSKLG